MLKSKKWIYDKPWLILGKGPSFEKALDGSVNIDNYNLFTLNHAGLYIQSKICNVVDLDVISKQLLLNCEYLTIPFHPHINFKPSLKTLDKFKLDIDSDRLLFYNLSTWKGEVPYNDKYIIQTKYFSSETAFEILAVLNIKSIYTLGIDGGNDYHSNFKKLGLKPLTNGQKTFDIQFKRLNEICNKHKLTWGKL
jgi:hypothetical protein